jgi:hypothetical protein
MDDGVPRAVKNRGGGALALLTEGAKIRNLEAVRDIDR